MAEELLACCYKVHGRDFDKGGETSTEIKSLLASLDLDPQLIRRAVIVAFEAEMNVVMYAREATLEVLVFPDLIRVQVVDRGPGIADIDWAMQEGHSTATEAMRARGFGAGLGLPNIQRNTDEFEVKSDAGVGTTLRYAVHTTPRPKEG